MILRGPDGEQHYGGVGRGHLPVRDRGSLYQAGHLGRVTGCALYRSSLGADYAPLLLGARV